MTDTKAALEAITDALARADLASIERKPNEWVSFKPTGRVSENGVPIYAGDKTWIEHAREEQRPTARLALNALRKAGFVISKQT